MSEIQFSNVTGQVPQLSTFDVRPADVLRGAEQDDHETASFTPMRPSVVRAVRDAPHWPRVFPGL